MIEIKTNEALDILDKLQFFQGQRAGRELWFDKPPVVQEQDLYNFNRDIEKIRSYIQSKNNMMQEIVERLGEASFPHKIGGETQMIVLKERIDELVKEVGGMNET